MSVRAVNRGRFHERGNLIECLLEDRTDAVPDPGVDDQLGGGQAPHGVTQQPGLREGIPVAGEKQHRAADPRPMGRALVPSLGAPRRMQRVGEEHQGSVFMLGGDQRRDAAAEGMATDCRLGGWGSRGEIDGHGALGTALRQLHRARVDAAPPQAGDLGRKAGRAARCAVRKVQASHISKRRAGEPKAWYT